MKDRNNKVRLYRVEGTKPNGRRKAHIKCSKKQADAMAHSWKRGKPNVLTHTGELVDLEPLRDVRVTASNPVTWPDEVPSIEAPILTRAADKIEDSIDWDGEGNEDYKRGAADAIAILVVMAETARREGNRGNVQADQVE